MKKYYVNYDKIVIIKIYHDEYKNSNSNTKTISVRLAC